MSGFVFGAFGLSLGRCGVWVFGMDFITSSSSRPSDRSNDWRLLQEIAAVSGKLQPGDLKRFRGEPLTKRRRKDDGTISWSGAGSVLTISQ